MHKLFENLQWICNDLYGRHNRESALEKLSNGQSGLSIALPMEIFLKSLKISYNKAYLFL